MFRSQSSDHHQGVNHRTCAITTYRRACLVVFRYVAVRCLCVCVYDVPVRVVSGYVLSVHISYAQTTYSHILEYDEARTPISTNCTSTVIDPLMMVRRL